MIASVRKRQVWLLAAILFVVMAFTIPLPFFILMAAGFLSYAALLEMICVGFIRLELIGVIVVLHAVVFGVLMVWLSRLIARYLLQYEGRAGWFRLGMVVVVLLLVGCLPVFGYTGHEAYPGVNSYRLLTQIYEAFTMS